MTTAITVGRILVGCLFAAGGMLCLGFAIALCYEAVAYVTGLVPTISGITAQALLQHPHWALVGYLFAGVLIGALATHFSHWTP